MSKKIYRSWISPTLILSGATVFASIFAVFAISKGDLNTSLLILQEVQPTKLITGVLATSFPILIIYSIIGLLKLHQISPESIGRIYFVFPAVYLLLVIALMAFSIRTNLLLLVFLLILVELFVYSFVGLIYRKFKKKDKLSWRSDKSRDLGKDFLYGIPSIVLLIFLGNWLPIEQIELEDRNLVGYVINQNNKEIVVLRENDRKIIFLNATDLVSRTLCEKNKGGVFDGFNVTNGKYPKCYQV